MALTREQKIMMAVDAALTHKRESLTAWEITFLSGLRSAYAKRSSLSVKQKAAAQPIFKRLSLDI